MRPRYILIAVFCLALAILSCSKERLAENKNQSPNPGERVEKVKIVSSTPADRVEVFGAASGTPSKNKKWLNLSVVFTPSKEEESIPAERIDIADDSGEKHPALAIAFPQKEGTSTGFVFFDDLKTWKQLPLFFIGRWAGLFDEKDKLKGVGYVYCENDQLQCEKEHITQIVSVLAAGTVSFQKVQPTKIFLLFEIPPEPKRLHLQIGGERDVLVQ